VKEDEIKQLLLSAEDLMSQCHEDNVSEMRSRFQTLSKQLQDVRTKADKHKVSLCYHLLTVNYVNFDMFVGSKCLRYVSGQTDRPIDKQTERTTDTVIAILCMPKGAM